MRTIIGFSLFMLFSSFNLKDEIGFKVQCKVLIKDCRLIEEHYHKPPTPCLLLVELKDKVEWSCNNRIVLRVMDKHLIKKVKEGKRYTFHIVVKEEDFLIRYQAEHYTNCSRYNLIEDSKKKYEVVKMKRRVW